MPDIDNNFKYHAPDEDQVVKYADIRAQAKQFAKLIDMICPDSREKSLAMTNLEQSVMWANASVARSKTKE